MPAPSGFTVQAGVGGGMQGVYGQFSQPEGVTGSSPAASQPAPDRVQCGQCGAILAVPANAPRFACPNCGALLASPNVPQVAKAVLPVADIKIIPSLALPQKSLETFLLPLEKKTKRPSFFGKM